MAEHNIFFGGGRTTNWPIAMFPQREVEPDETMEADQRHSPNVFSLTRRLVWKDSREKCGCDFASSDALYEYLAENPIEVDDILNTHIMPRYSSLERLWINVEEPLAGFTFDIQVRGNANSLGGTPTAPVTTTIATGIDGGVEGSQLIVLPDPIYFDQNDMLQLVVTGLPAEGISCSQVLISPVVMEYCRGLN